MPSACTKPENKASKEAGGALEKCVTIVANKTRNLEKRKVRMDGYRAKLANGEVLNEAQQESLLKYDSTIVHLEIYRDLNKQFQEFVKEHAQEEKVSKKELKKAALAKRSQELGKIREILKLQDLLSHMGSEDVREDFRNGANGAVAVTEENLEQLDELYKLITPSRDGEKSFVEQLRMAADHILSFIDSRTKNVAGTTYKDIKELVDKINSCDYFEQKLTQEQTTEPKEADVPSQEQTTATTTTPKETHEPERPAPTADLPPPAAAVLTPEAPAPVVPDPLPQPDPAPAPLPQRVPLPTQPQPLAATPAAAAYDDDSFFTTPRYGEGQTRAFQEIVSSVQGSFNFLQDSEIDSDFGRPAPGAYQPPGLHPTADQTTTATYSQPDLGAQHAAGQPVSQSQRAVANDPIDYGAAAAAAADTLPQPQSAQLSFPAAVESLVSEAPQYEASYGTTLLSQSGGAAASTAVFRDQSSLMSSLGARDQDPAALSGSSSAAASSTGPPPIPLPNQTLSGQQLAGQQLSGQQLSGQQLSGQQLSGQQLAGQQLAGQPLMAPYPEHDNAAGSQAQDKKAYTMNPNADPFKSTAIFNTTMSSGLQQTATGGNHGAGGGASGMLGQEEIRKPAWGAIPQQSQPQQPQHTQQQQPQRDESDAQNDFQSFGGPSSYRGNASRGGGPRGGPRGGARGNVNGGYPRAGNRGGGGGGAYSGSGRGAGYANGRGASGGRGGGAWQGYGSRGDYRGEGGYQGYASGGFSSGGSSSAAAAASSNTANKLLNQRRGGLTAGVSQRPLAATATPAADPAGMRGGSGGQPRGGMRGGNRGGGQNSGFGRPTGNQNY